MERGLCTSYAAVMIYDNDAKKWQNAEGVQGVAKVQIFYNPQNNTYRVVGRMTQDNNKVVLNSAILKGLKYNQATCTFHQWRDSRHVYGLNFQSPDDAESFAGSMMSALEALQQPAPPRPQQIAPPVPPSSQNGPSQNDRMYSQQHQHDTNRRSGNLDNHMMQTVRPSPPEPPGPAVSRAPPAAPPVPPQPPAAPAAPPVPAAPAAPAAPPAPPQPPAAPAAPAAPPAPPAPSAGGGGGPPPPPPPPAIGGPPPAPSGGGGGPAPGAGGLAAALAGAKLKKVNRSEISDSSSASVGSSGGGGGGSSRPPAGGGGGDFMSSLQQKLNARRQASENPSSSSDSSSKPSGRTSPPGAPKATSKPWERKTNGVESTTSSASPQLNRPPPVSNRNSADGIRIMRPPSGVDQHQSNSPTSPGFSGGRRPSQPALNGNAGGDGQNSLDYEKLKQEILTEMRKELQKTKQEIIDAIRQELSRR